MPPESSMSLQHHSRYDCYGLPQHGQGPSSQDLFRQLSGDSSGSSRRSTARSNEADSPRSPLAYQEPRTQPSYVGRAGLDDEHVDRNHVTPPRVSQSAWLEYMSTNQGYSVDSSDAASLWYPDQSLGGWQLPDQPWVNYHSSTDRDHGYDGSLATGRSPVQHHRPSPVSQEDSHQVQPSDTQQLSTRIAVSEQASQGFHSASHPPNVGASGSAPLSNEAKHKYCCLVAGCNKQFKRFADLRRHYDRVHPSDAALESWPCDHKYCPRDDKRPFGRKDHYREHLRDVHLEDIIRANTENDSEWLKTCAISVTWWRCSKCLARVDLNVRGWQCPCGRPCEEKRRRVRESREQMVRHGADDPRVSNIGGQGGAQPGPSHSTRIKGGARDNSGSSSKAPRNKKR